ncbi:uncharacterized protein HD556DRAFT_1026340 [Suillus plorans]|uniref:Xylosidase/arabinosidase n=1 Tax=Suillus plorans TaxID=116603 RepID=A0A9P7DQ14_9AGAM|nr:uncharacterized protein HD556DRAFT_1026340 [Suillus plorans]KAG1800311.1 hypothetical protein HD556DRAFT_1026340 [Suillus plorans]
MSGQELEGRILKRANPKTIQDKFLVGYQGWFTCNGDGEPMDPNHHGWMHWFDKPISGGGHPNTDLWPDVSEYSPSELFPAPDLQNADGEPVFLFSSRNSKTVRRHFHWMALHGVDGAFLQRFATQCDVEAGSAAIRKIRDEVGDRVREAAEAEGRVFAIMYDVSGVHPDKIQRVLEQDWMHLIRDKCVLDSPNYLREKGKPVIALWGFGFNHRNHSPQVVRSIVNFFRSFTPGGAYLMAGVPGHWRTSTSDSDPDPEFLRVWTEEFDALSPWTIGRYGNEEEAERWGNEKVKQDFDFLKRRGDEGGKRVDYIPVVLPGGSGYNLSRGQWGLNGIKRNGGHFLWKQIYAARHAGVRIIYGAMWDEYDEGTAFMPVVSSSKQLPVHSQFNFLALDADGHSLPSDWYMRIAGFAAESLRGDHMLHESFPVKELQDYWATRPRYEETTPAKEETEQLNEAQRAYHDWAAQEEGAVVDEAPPPYMLEDEMQSPQTSSVQNTGLVPPEATNPVLDRSSLSSVPPPSPPMSTKPECPPGLDKRTQQSYQQPSSSYTIARPSSQVSSSVPSSAAVAYLAGDLTRQTLSHLPQHASGFSSISPSVIQMPSVEVSPSAAPISPLPASATPVSSWPQRPVQQHNLPSHPRVSPLDSLPSLIPQREPFGIGGPGYHGPDSNVRPHDPASLPRVEHSRTTSNSGAPCGSSIATNRPAHPHPVPNPLVQDYCQRQIPPTQLHPGGSHSPRPYSPPEWGTQRSPPPVPPRPPMHTQSLNHGPSNQSASILTGNGRGRGFNSRGRGRGRGNSIAGHVQGSMQGNSGRPSRGAGRGY